MSNPIRPVLLAALAAVSFAAQSSAQCQRFETWLFSNNSGANGGQIFFDLAVTNPGGVRITKLNTNVHSLVGAPVGLDVYIVLGSYHGHENQKTAWTLISSGSGIAGGANFPSLVEIDDFTLAPGTYGVALVMTTPTGHRYIGSTNIPPPPVYSNSDLTITAGAALGTPWTGAPFTPRMWSGVIVYNCASAPTNYCTAGTSSHGCVPAISAASNPSVSQQNACTIAVAQVEGRASGLIFYGISQIPFAPIAWGPGSTSFKCIHAPVERTPVQNSGGTQAQCDGVLTLDWNAYQTTHPNALGAPWTVGSKVYLQGLYRDPLAAQATNLSDAIELTYEP
jgi:hypothetical protein